MNILLIEINPFVQETVPISLGYIASFLKSKGFCVKILTIGQNTSLSRSAFHEIIRSFKPSLIGFSAYQRVMLYITGLARFIKSINKNIKIVIGGPQATFMPSSAFTELPDVDYICRSPGELTMLGIARAIENGMPFLDLSGVSYKDENDAVFDTPELEGYTDLDRYPSAYLNDVFDYSRMKEAIMLTSRGCPHHCIYCYTPDAFKHKISFHSVERVVEEIKWITKKGVNRFWFADPNISYKPLRLIEILDSILKEGLKLEIWLQTRADLVTSELLKKMKKAGVSTIAFGLESASERVLSKLGKHITSEKVAEAIKLAQSHGIEVELFTIYGLPYETFEDAVKTLEFVKKNNVKIMGNTNSQQLQIYFGTHMAQHYEDYNIRPLNNDRPAYLSIGSQYKTDHMGRSELSKIRQMWQDSSIDGGKRIVS
ncbi:MAG: B12-binding domain-containing radical SAM protein [Desulfobacterales bacterium]|nr:B12-binding domain-containing radical SAM protein [Desulfobacterales bacterium]